MQVVSGLLVLIQQKKSTGLGPSQHLRVMQSRNGKAHLPWGYRTSLTKALEELNCPGRNRTGRTWKSQSANVAKAVMLHGKVKQKWFFVSSMIRVTVNEQLHVQHMFVKCHHVMQTVYMHVASL